jgi:hypothetical protein
MAATPPRILLLAGPPSHGPGLHEFPRGMALLADALNASGLPLVAEARQGWPEDDATVLAAEVVALYSDGLEDHVAKGKGAVLRQRREAGGHLVVLHFAIEPSATDTELRQAFTESIGGYFDAEWSVNPIWTARVDTWPGHAITRGLGAWSMDDEWYFHIKFPGGLSRVTPVLAATPSVKVLGQDGPRSGNPTVRAALERGEPQLLGWTHVSENGARGFGFTGGHFHRNWYDETFRRLVLNGIVWTAGVEVPAGGVRSATPRQPVYAALDEAIARGDAEDVRRHVAEDPNRALGAAGSRMRPLHAAILRRRADIAAILLEAGADPSQPDGAGRSPVHMATERTDLAMVTLLADRGATLVHRDKAGWTPLHLAGARNQLEITRLLLERGADPNILSELGGNALHEAAVGGSAELIRLLLARGAKPEVRSKQDVTPLDLARQYKNAAAIAVLESLPAVK